MLISATVAHFFNNIANFRFGCFGVLCNLLRSGKIKHRRPCIRHLHRIISIYFTSLYCCICHIADSPGSCTVSSDKIQIICLEIRFFQELFDDTRQSPILSRRYNANHIIFKRIIIVSQAILNRNVFPINSLCEPGCNIFAISRCRKNNII